MTDPYSSASDGDPTRERPIWESAESNYQDERAPLTPVELLRARRDIYLSDARGSSFASYEDRGVMTDGLLTQEPLAAPEAGGITSPPGVPPSPSDQGRPRRATRLLAVGLAILAIVAVVVTVVQLRSASDTTGAGYLEPTAAAYLDFASNGVVTDVLVKPGDHVRAGEVLAEQDSSALEAKLAADQSTLYADRARVLELGAGSASQQAQIAALVKQANQTLATAQAKAAGSLSTAQSHVAVAKDRLSQAQSTLADDQAQYGSDVASCNAPGRTVASIPSNAQCVQIQATLTNDNNSVANANASLSQAQLALQTAQNSTAQDLALAGSEASLANARQNEAAPTAAAGSATSVAVADADVSKDIANVATDQSDISGAAITSPVAGVVGSIGAQAGDYATPNGVHTFTQSGVATAANGFQLFAPPAQSSSSSSNSGLNPVVIVYSTTMQVTAQVSEHAVTKLSVGEAATVTLPAVGNRKLAAVIEDINPTSVNKDGKVYYLIDLSITQSGLTDTMPGMTANVSFSH